MPIGEHHGTETFGKCSLEKQSDGTPAWVCDAATQHIDTAKNGGKHQQENTTDSAKQATINASSIVTESKSSSVLPDLSSIRGIAVLPFSCPR
jgi:hypothetical protein